MIKIQCPCGETFIADNQHIGKHIQCKNCKSILAIHENISPVPATIQGNESNQASVYQASKPSKVGPLTLSRKFKTIIVVIFILIIGAILLANLSLTLRHKSQPSSEPLNSAVDDKPIRTEHFKPIDVTKEYQPAHSKPIKPTTPRRLPLGATPFGAGVHAGKSTLTIDNGTDTDALVRVLRIGSSKELIRNVYIPHGKEFTATQLPLGDYILRIAFGYDWEAKRKSFNFDRSFSQSESFAITESTWNEDTDDGYIKHTTASKMSVTLHKVRNGNFKTHPIPENEFRE